MLYFIFNIAIILLPITFYLLMIAYSNNYKKKYDNFFLAFVLLVEVLLFVIFRDFSKSLILINIPLLIAYLKRLELTSILLSFIIGFYYIFLLNFNIYFIFFEYVLYFVIYLIFNKKIIKPSLLIYIFVFIKSITLSIEIFYFNVNNKDFFVNFLDVIIKMGFFYLGSYFILKFLLKGEEIMKLNTALKELEKEKVLRTSLFKMTHEIKNPIAVCKGYLDMLDLNDKKKIDKYIPIIKGEIERTLTLMDDYLEYTKIKINKDVADIYMLLDEVIKSFDLFFKENHITLKNNIPDDELFLEIDYNRVQQVLVNLLKNAHEAMDLNKKEKIIKIYTNLRKKWFDIIIEDNGIGMDETTLSSVMDLFFTTKTNGTGLGTSLSKEIMEGHGGKIKYISSLGVGTKVILSFPLSDNL